MNYTDLEKDEKKIEKIEKYFSDKAYFDNCYRARRHNQIIETKTKARKEKRRQQRESKREQAQKEKISVALIKESVKDDFEMMQ